MQPYPCRRPGEEPGDHKDRFRVAMRARRAERSDRDLAVAAGDLARVVGSVPAVQSAATVAAYVSRSAEPPTGPLLAALARAGVRVLLPVLGEGLSRCWALYTGPDDLVVRAPGRPPEPTGPALPAQTLAEADVVLVPALAVDTGGTRLGQGGGWYDRALPLARSDAAIVALVFAEEVYDAATRPLPVQPHDRPVGAVATPRGWHALG